MAARRYRRRAVDGADASAKHASAARTSRKHPPRGDGKRVWRTHPVRAGALDELRRGMWQQIRHTDPERATWIKGTRFAIRRRANNLHPSDRTILDELKVTNQDLYAD